MAFFLPDGWRCYHSHLTPLCITAEPWGDFCNNAISSTFSSQIHPILQHGETALVAQLTLAARDPVSLTPPGLLCSICFTPRVKNQCFAFTFFFLSSFFYVEGNEFTSIPIIRTILNLSNNKAYGQPNMHKLISFYCLIKCHTCRVPRSAKLISSLHMTVPNLHLLATVWRFKSFLFYEDYPSMEAILKGEKRMLVQC